VAPTRQPSTTRIASADRAVVLLDALADAGELGTNELARRTGLTPSTVSRQLGTLTASGLVEHVPSTGRYRLGIRIVRLANSVLGRLDVRAVARPHLEELVRVSGETATLSVQGGEDAITVDFVPSAHYVRHVTQLGRPSIGHATAAGKAMLAFGDRPLPAPPLRAFTERTITDVDALARELERVRRRGHAEAIEEREPGLSAIAAPVFESTGALAAVVALQGPTPRFGRSEIRAALPLLLREAAAISTALGFVAESRGQTRV
jgi:IclR family acetate operon transcriptional repressor